MTAKGWAVVGPDGRVHLNTVALTQEASQGIMFWLSGYAVEWPKYAAKGYRCVRVTVTVEDERP
jgi:hypothetical protein